MTDPGGVFSGPAVTALGLAAARAVETSRSDRLIDDPIARVFFEAAAVQLPMRLTWPDSGEPVTDSERLHLHGSRYIGLRTRFYDDLLLRAAHQGLRQGVLIGAGLDSRAFRLDLPGDFHLIELDQMPLLEWKQAVLEAQAAAATCRRSWIGADLREDWSAALTRCGFDAAQPTAFIAEGLLPYLAPAEQRSLVDEIHRLAATNSVLALDRVIGDPHAAGRAASLSRRSGLDMSRLLASGEDASIASALRDRGWRIQETPVAVLAASYARDLTDPFEASADPSTEPPWLETSFVQGVR